MTICQHISTVYNHFVTCAFLGAAPYTCFVGGTYSPVSLMTSILGGVGSMISLAGRIFSARLNRGLIKGSGIDTGLEPLLAISIGMVGVLTQATIDSMPRYSFCL